MLPRAMRELRDRWGIDPSIRYLNHGSFGATPRAVLDAQHALRVRMERNLMQFCIREWDARFDHARACLGALVGARADDLAVVPNATTGVNAVLRWFPLAAGDEVLLTNHEYNACANILRDAAERAGAKVVVAEVPFPLRSEGEVVDAVLSRVTARTRLALLDHVTSQSALVLPVAELVAALRERGVETLVDGAHAPGMLPLDLDALGAAFYTGNLHKWVCTPKGAAFLHVREDWQRTIRPLAISHGANSARTDRSRFRLEWDWTGTFDPTAFLVLPEAIDAMTSLFPGGWSELRAHNRALALRARAMLCEALDVPEPAPPSMIASMASVPLPKALVHEGIGAETSWCDPLQHWLWEGHGIEVPVMPWPDAARRVLRVSAQAYNDDEEYRALADALRDALRA